ncbi:DNA-formamidopyrimidine glycosylase family protein [Ruania halotolerans]|uniref:DNA-formamidopyrimidine glycosylase family protein n=1 Tax=Ruania halotolerans TaxID=2897773 RepID=UPI001E32CE16|nr:DNA-formamidopyrimidine glycosylase family protein [Ruania halotolerans]UFU05163.1 Fpg/Nei family DNA glycosylase [Ruania halotolerans]
MPEGDVLLRVARRLTTALADGPLVRADLRWPDVSGAELVGRRSLGTVCYGKHLLTRFDDGRTMRSHLRMDGRWLVRRTMTPPEPLRRPMTRAVIATSAWTCVGDHLGMLDLLRTRDEPTLLRHLGPNLMADDVDTGTAAENCRAQGERAIGAVLLDQRVAAGIGTIYLAETLWRHQISPWRPARAVPDPQALFVTAAALMRRSADAPTLTATGARDQPTYVHGRAGLVCLRCGDVIAVAPVEEAPYDRPAFHCPTCQVD